jgi:hypothetical protein
MNLILEGMAYPLYAYEERYWRAVDPYLADLIHGAFVDETRHVMLGAATVRNLLERSSDSERERARRACATARLAMGEIFTYYVRKFVGLFDAVARRHQDLFAGAEMAPGHRIVDTPYDQQVAMIQTNIDLEHGRLLARAGLV